MNFYDISRYFKHFFSFCSIFIIFFKNIRDFVLKFCAIFIQFFAHFQLLLSCFSHFLHHFTSFPLFLQNFLNFWPFWIIFSRIWIKLACQTLKYTPTNSKKKKYNSLWWICIVLWSSKFSRSYYTSSTNIINKNLHIDNKTYNQYCSIRKRIKNPTR